RLRFVFFLIRVGPTNSASFCLDLMKKYRCRHLLVFAEAAFIGIVALRDLVTFMMDEKEEVIEPLEHDITS
ncbi:MAG: CBS domain-containing protein, partial [Candidatus Binatia bacterium]